MTRKSCPWRRGVERRQGKTQPGQTVGAVSKVAVNPYSGKGLSGGRTRGPEEGQTDENAKSAKRRRRRVQRLKRARTPKTGTGPDDRKETGQLEEYWSRVAFAEQTRRESGLPEVPDNGEEKADSEKRLKDRECLRSRGTFGKRKVDHDPSAGVG